MSSYLELLSDPFFLALRAVREKCDRALSIYEEKEKGFTIGGVSLQANISAEQATLLQAEIELILTELPALIAAIPVNKLNQTFSSIGGIVSGDPVPEPIAEGGV